MFFYFFLFSFAFSFLFFFFSFYYKKLHNQQQEEEEEEGKSQNEPTLLNRSLSNIVEKKAQTPENDPTRLPHSLLLEILPSDSAKWAGLFTGENQPRGDTGQVGSGREGERCESGGEDQRTKKKKKRGKKKRLDSKGEEENGEERCSFAEESGPGSRVKPELVCLYPFTSTSSATQRKIKQQYDQLVKCHENKGLTLAQVGEFANCLIEARSELQHKSEVIKRKFTITKALLFKADRSSFDRLRQQIYKLEMEQKRLEEDAFVYNWLQQQLKLSPAYKKMLEIGACMELKAKSSELMEGTDNEFADISFEELLAQEKKDSFWPNNNRCYNFLSSSSTVMALCSTFCPRISNKFRAIPISSFPSKPLLSLSFKAFSSQAPDASSSQDKFSGRVGFLGLGIMGSPMAQNLIKAGCDVTVWNRTKSRCDPLISLGAKYRSSPEEVAANCDVTFAMLSDPESAIDVACGKNGAVSGMVPGKGYVDVSTVDGATSKLINGHIKATGALFLEAPVSGSKKPAEDGQLIFLTAGDRSLYDSVAPLLDIMGKSRFYLGEVGNGAAMKLVVNMIMGSMMASFSEGLLLSKKVGLDPSVLVEVVSQGAISAPMYSLKGPSMVKSNYPTAFPLKHQQKDLRLALGLAESVSQSTPIAAAANELYKVAKSYGLSDEDFSAVIEALKAKSHDSA
ncbi:hypothetical protein REPUB_Repub14bG0064600 [Reevesia pubescens]